MFAWTWAARRQNSFQHSCSVIPAIPYIRAGGRRIPSPQNRDFMYWIYWWHLGATAPYEELVGYLPELCDHGRVDHEFEYGEFRMPHSIAFADAVITQVAGPGSSLEEMARKLTEAGIEFVLVGRNQGDARYRVWVPGASPLVEVGREDPDVTPGGKTVPGR